MERLPQLDGLRGIAILMVFVTHALHVRGLWMGVDLFFVLSGFLITGILLRLRVRPHGTGYWRSFYTRRAKRILPPYIGFLIFAALVLAPHWQNSWLYYLCLASNFPLAMGTVPIVALAPLWSLAVEEQFYCAWPWIVRFCSTRGLRLVALMLLVGAPVLRAAFTPLVHSHFPIYALTPFRADTLACGAFIAICDSEQTKWARSKKLAAFWVVLGSLLAIFGFSAAFPSFRTGANGVLFNTVGYSLSTFMFGGLLVFALTAGGAILKVLSWGGLRFMGRISYTFYLYHVTVLYVLEHRVHGVIPLALASFVITTAIAAASWHLIESPILYHGRETATARVTGVPTAGNGALIPQDSPESVTA